ncbi:daunorubicin resistance protein DrrA family ABC transporter ATP-binding protein [Saccharomonospora azurea]|uniref:Daunorubicin resistance ABC transporter ATP-binding subunit n=1 Tax=Saccharomonospora azurea NA-128 TaxID=882081 RepID=H8G4J5_9PSEU|nr:daunorubicin resistance protein DrrA family ABC transporter ATP-binding protein [Saccharomonospora azurea]EHY88144.1 daunorubicin resistance ABC transporter ATP-binding subunit [Saccharomonospora azurea NA-128]
MSTSPGGAIVVAEGVHKRFGDTHALAGLDLTVPEGTVYGLLGPNGAGKSTAVRVLTTLTRPDSGTVTVAGHDVVAEPAAVRTKIGLAGQHAALDEGLTGRENLRIFGKLFRLSSAQAKARADELLERFDLAHAGDRLVRTYSGGMRRRLDLISSLIVSPKVLFLDEPTTGLDPRSRNEIWATVRELVDEGTTVLLTTQYLEEADQLAENIAVIDHGTVIASGTPHDLKARIGGRLDVVVPDSAELPDAATVLAALTGSRTEPAVDVERALVSVSIGTDTVTLPEVVRHLDQAGVKAVDVGIRQPTLDEVFLTLTGESDTAAQEANR